MSIFKNLQEEQRPSPIFMPHREHIVPPATEKLEKMHAAKLPAALEQKEQRDIFEGVILAEFAASPREEKRLILKKLLGEVYLRKIENILNSSSIAPHVFLRNECNTSPFNAVRLLANEMGIKAEYLFNSFPMHTGNGSQTSSVTDAYPRELDVNGVRYSLRDTDDTLAYDGHLDQTICTYQSACGKAIHLPARRTYVGNRFVMAVGYQAPSAIFFSRTELCHARKAVLFIINTDESLSFRRLAKETQLLQREGVLVTGCFSPESALISLDFKEMVGQKVIVIPPANPDGLREAQDWVAKFQAGGASEVNVYPWSIFLPGVVPPPLSGGMAWEQEVQSRSLDLREPISLSTATAHIYGNALPAAKYPKWLAGCGLTDDCSTPLPCKTTSEGFQAPRLLRDIPTEQPKSDGPPTVADFLRPEFLTLLWGPSDAGKGWITTELVLAHLLGHPAFFLTASQALAPRRVLYIAAEESATAFKSRCEQLLRWQSCEMGQVDQYLEVLALEDDVSLLNPTWQEDLFRHITTNNIAIVVLDNILALAPSATKNSGPLLAFINELKKLNVSVVLVHHAGKKGDNFLGASELESLAQNVIKLSGTEQIAGHQSLGSEVQAALKEHKQIVSILVEKCKVGAELKGQSAMYILPLRDPWRRLVGNLPDACATVIDPALPAEAAIVNTPTGLTDDQSRLFQLFDEGRDKSRKDVEAALGWKADKAGNELKALKEMGHLVVMGESKNTRYQRA